jgi:predicted nucleic acid-binding protein
VRDALGADAGIYLDSSALAKLYVPEPESDTLEAFLKGRRDLMISELAITEVLSAVARRRREGTISAHQALEIRDAVLADADSGSFHRLDMSPVVHREAERLLFHIESVALRTLDALHVAAALLGSATHVVTYDARTRAACLARGTQNTRLVGTGFGGVDNASPPRRSGSPGAAGVRISHYFGSFTANRSTCSICGG